MDFESFTGKQKMRRQKTVRKRKLWARRAGALLTAAAITASLCVPNVLAEEPQQTAQEQTAQSTETQTAEVQSTETQPEAETSTEAKPEADPVAETKPEAEPGTKAQPEEMQNTETQTDSAEAQQTKESAEAQKEEAEAEPETTEKEKVADSAKAAAAASETTETTEEAKDGQYDTTKPVIEKVEFPQQGQTLTTKDTLKFYVYAYDADSEIAYVSANAYFQYGDNSGSSSGLSFTYDEEKQCYVGELSLEDVNADSGNIISIRVVDNAGNYVEMDSYSDTGEPLYAFSFQKDEVDYAVKNFVLDQQGQTLKDGDTVSVSFDVEPSMESDPGNICVRFKNETAGYGTILLWTSLNTQTGKYEGSTQIYNPSAGKWVLDQVGMSRVGEMAAFQLENPENFWFNTEKIEEVVNDKESPVITSINLDKNGEVVESGDTVTITVKAEDNVGLDEFSGYAYMSPDQDIDGGSQYVSLNYDKTSDSWIGTFEIDENTYPCEWYLNSVFISDLAGNLTNIGDYRPDFYSTQPYYVQVVNKETFVNKTYDGRITFLVLNEDGDWESISEVEKENLEKRATFKESGIEIPAANHSYQSAKQTGWIDAYGNQVDENTTVTSNISYMTVYAKYDKSPVRISKEYLDSEGETVYSGDELLLLPDGSTYGDLKKYVETIPAPSDSYTKLKFQGWMLNVSKNDDEILGPSESVMLTADYDQNTYTIWFRYLNNKGEWTDVSKLFIYEDGATYGDLYKEGYAYMPADASEDLKMENWEISKQILDSYPEDQELPVDGVLGRSLTVTADYGDKAVAVVYVNYYSEDGRAVTDHYTDIVDKGTKKQVLFDKYVPKTPETYPGLKFTGWDLEFPDTTIESSGTSLNAYAEYSNYIIRFIIDDRYAEGDWSYSYYGEKEFDFIQCIVAEEGDVITLPTEFEGYENVKWLNAWPEDGKVTVEEDITFRGYGEKTATDPSDPEKPVDPEEPTDPEKPVDPEEPSNPEEPSKPEEPSNPGTEIPADTVDSVVQEIKGASTGSTVQVDMGNATVLSKKILEAAKGQDVNIQLNMGSYTWTINGKDIKASDLKDIDMKVTMNTDAIPSSVVKKLAGDNPTMQLSLAHEGDFGFQAKLTLNVGSQYAGKFGNLYYYDSDGKLVYINSGKVAESGNVSLTFSHASDYVVVLADQQYISNGDGQTGASNTSGNEGTNQGQSGADVVKTGDSAPTVTLLIVMGAAVVVIAGAVIVKKRGSAK